MLQELDKAIKESILEENNNKIKPNETLDEYLSSFKNDQLTRLAISHIFINNSFDDLSKVYNLNNKSKKYIISYIKDNLEKIISAYINIVDTHIFDSLKELVLKKGYVKYNLDDYKKSLHFITFLKSFALAKVYYDKKKETIEFYIPSEFVEIMKKSFNNKNILKINKRHNEVCEYVSGVTEAYGIITITKLHEIFEKQMYKIDIHELNQIIECRTMIDDCFNTYEYNYDDKLICNLVFDDEYEAFDFYENITENYYNFSKKDFKEINEDIYVDNLESYHNLIEYLFDNFEGVEYDMEMIDRFLIMDYIFTAQLDEKKADTHFMNKINDMFEINILEKSKMLKMMQDIFKDYPKWRKRGNK